MSTNNKPQSLGLFEASKSKTAANISVKREELAAKPNKAFACEIRTPIARSS